MKSMRERLKIRMSKDRTHSAVTFNLPDDVIADLQEIAPALGFSSYLTLARSYVGEGLRKDISRLDESPILRLTESLRKQGMSDEMISEIIAESNLPQTRLAS